MDCPDPKQLVHVLCGSDSLRIVFPGVFIVKLRFAKNISSAAFNIPMYIYIYIHDIYMYIYIFIYIYVCIPVHFCYIAVVLLLRLYR